METNATPNAAQPKSRRRWYQFSLRTLLIVVVICAVGCAWLARRIDQKRKEWDGFKAICDLGGTVWFDHGPPSADVPGPKWLRQILGENFFCNVIGVDLQNSYASDSDLQIIENFTQLERLELFGHWYGDAVLAHLNGLAKLKRLVLQFTEITDAGLIQLTGLSQLERLDISDNEITDAGVAHLKGLTVLQVLDLSGTKVTDAALIYLQGMHGLRELDLRGTNVTDAGVSGLKKALPSCTVLH